MRTIKTNVVVVTTKQARTGKTIKIAATYSKPGDISAWLTLLGASSASVEHKIYPNVNVPVIEGGPNDGQYDLSQWEK